MNLKMFACAACAWCLSVALSAQPDRVITYEQLQHRKVERKFSWTNPDQSTEEVSFVEMAIPVDKHMKELTRRFVRDNYGWNSIWVEPRLIVIHSMDLGNMQATLEESSFLDRRMPQSWTTVVKAGELPSGAHFIIDMDGTIYCLTPPVDSSDDARTSYDRQQHRWMIRRHHDGNPMAIGIENVTPCNDSFEDLSAAQVASNAKLVRWLLWLEQGSITHVASHHQFNDSARFESMLKAYSLELPRPMYRAWTRRDVGDRVLDAILAEVRRKGWPVKNDF